VSQFFQVFFVKFILLFVILKALLELFKFSLFSRNKDFQIVSIIVRRIHRVLLIVKILKQLSETFGVLTLILSELGEHILDFFHFMLKLHKV
jgi:hypothetical protein